jgi:hypothetical protein
LLGNSASGGPSAADVNEVTRPRTQGLKRIVADDKSTLSIVENKVDKKAKRARLPSAQGSELVASRSRSLVSGAPGTKDSETKGRQKKRPQDVPKADQADVKNNVEEKLEKQTKGRQKKRPQDAEGQTTAESTQGAIPEALESLHSAASGKHPMPDRKMEFALWEKGFTCVAGVDEAGRGPLAGPVVAAACVLPKDADASLLCGIADSKDVKEEAREAIYERLVNHPGVRYAIGVRDHSAIDRVNILQALKRPTNACEEIY